MGVERYEQAGGLNSEVYIARTARILAAMRRASDGLVGMTVEVLPVGEGDSQPAVFAAEKAGERLYVISGNEELHPESRGLDADRAIRYGDGGVVRVSFDPTQEESLENSQRQLFLERTVDAILAEAQGLQDSVYESGIEVVDADIGYALHRAIIRGTNAAALLAEIRGNIKENPGVRIVPRRQDGGIPRERIVNPETVAMLEWAIAQIGPARDALAAREEIDMVNAAGVTWITEPWQDTGETVK